MTPGELKTILDEMLALPAETEWVEFKEAKSNLHFDDLGQYFSALSNEANLKGKACGWLVLGVQNKPRRVVGSQYRVNRKELDNLKHEVATHTTNRITFTEIFELIEPAGRVVMFQIPAAMRGVPTAWKGHFYGRDGESLGPLNPIEYDYIRAQTRIEDWSAGIVDGATVHDLDPAAILRGREEFKKKHPKVAAEVDGWNDLAFLNKAKVCINGKITRATIVLLGREESEHHLLPAVARITWLLKDAQGTEKDYEHFGPPLLLKSESVFGRIRNLTYRYLKNNALFPTEITQYDPWVIREALHNCIAHQDYTLNGRINVVEQEECLLFTNLGMFIPRTVESVIRQDAPPDQYRNPSLAAAMVNLNMIDTIGSGIKRMFQKQRDRFFPMPDYDLTEAEKVKVRITGKVLDENYTRILIAQTDLGLWDVIALDRVQKRLSITEEQFKSLKQKGLIEGRRPSGLFVSAKVAAMTGKQAEYIRNRGLDKQHYKQLVLDYLKKFGPASKGDIETLLLDKLAAVKDTEQKRTWIRNLLQQMAHRDKTIRAVGVKRWAKWSLTSPPKMKSG